MNKSPADDTENVFEGRELMHYFADGEANKGKKMKGRRGKKKEEPDAPTKGRKLKFHGIMCIYISSVGFTLELRYLRA